MSLALLLGWLTGHESAGSIAAGSAFTVGFAIFHETLASTMLSMAMVTLGISSATLAGSLGAEWTWTALLLVLVAALNYAVLAKLGPNAGWIGQQSAVFLIVASYFRGGVHYAFGRAGMVLAGGVLQMAFSGAALALQRSQQTDAAEPGLDDRIRARAREVITALPTVGVPETVSYAMRLVCTLLLATAIYRVWHLRNGYWVPMTAVLVLKPQWSDTLSRGIARMAGTVAGAAVALLLARTMQVDTVTVLLLTVGSAWVCYAFQAVNYALFSLFVTLYIVFLFRFGGFSQTSAAHIRLANTVLGGGLALAVDAGWMMLRGRSTAALSPEGADRSATS